MNFHRMSLEELREVRKQLRAVKKPRAALKHRMLLITIDAWIRKRKNEQKSAA